MVSARDDLEVPVTPLADHGVVCSQALRATGPTSARRRRIASARRASASGRMLAGEPVRLAGVRREQELVRRAAGGRAEQRRAGPRR